MGFVEEHDALQIMHCKPKEKTDFNKIIKELSRAGVEVQSVSKTRIIDLSIDYDELLDIWFEEVMKKVEKAEELETEEHLKNNFSYKEGHLRGYADGLIMATSILSRLEKRAKKKIIHDEIRLLSVN